MLSQIEPEVRDRLKAVMAKGDPKAIAEFIGGVIQRRLYLENWLDVVFPRQEGNLFIAPVEAVGRFGMKAVRGLQIESFQVARRKIALVPERYASRPQMDVGDLQDGDIAQLADMIFFANRGITDQILIDGYSLLSTAATFGVTRNGVTNFHLVVDDGSTNADGSPVYIQKIRRQMDAVMNVVADSTISKHVRGFIARKTIAADLIRLAGFGQFTQHQFDLSPDVVPGDYRGIPIASLSGARDDNNNFIFPSNDIYAVAEGAGSYAITKDVQVLTGTPTNLEQDWTVWTERIMALWFAELVHRIYVIDQTAGAFSGLLYATSTEMTLQATKYVDTSTVTAHTLLVYTGADPGTGTGGTTFAVGGVTVDGSGKLLNVKFSAPLSSGTYKIYNSASLKDIGTTAFGATSDGTPIATFTI